MDEPPALVELSETELAQALARFRILQPYLEGQTSLTAIAQDQAVTLRTLQRWVARYRGEGISGLIRKGRADQGAHRLDPARVEQAPVDRLGLSRIRERLELFGGHLALHTQPGAGTEAMLVLPLAVVVAPAGKE